MAGTLADGYAANEVVRDQDGDLHINGGRVVNDSGVDVSGALDGLAADTDRLKAAALYAFVNAQTIDMADDELALSVDATNTQITSNVLYVDPNSAGGTEDLLLPAEADANGVMLIIVNTAGGAEDIVVKEDSDTTTIATISQNEIGVVVCDGTTWRGGVMATT